jgi:hypothetical protein
MVLVKGPEGWEAAGARRAWSWPCWSVWTRSRRLKPRVGGRPAHDEPGAAAVWQTLATGEPARLAAGEAEVEVTGRERRRA